MSNELTDRDREMMFVHNTTQINEHYMVKEVKKLAKNTLNSKWNKDNSKIREPCSFCGDTMNRSKDGESDCEICWIDKRLCDMRLSSREYTLYTIISIYIDNNGSKYIEKIHEINHFKGYKLMVKCLTEIAKYGYIKWKTSMDLNKYLNEYFPDREENEHLRGNN